MVHCLDFIQYTNKLETTMINCFSRSSKWLRVRLYCVVFVGWAMQIAGFIFLDRKWEEDQENISKCLKVFKDSNYKAQVSWFTVSSCCSSWFSSKVYIIFAQRKGSGFVEVKQFSVATDSTCLTLAMIYMNVSYLKCWNAETFVYFSTMIHVCCLHVL